MLAGPTFLSLSWGPTPTTLPALASLAPVIHSHSLLGARLRLSGVRRARPSTRLRATLSLSKGRAAGAAQCLRSPPTSAAARASDGSGLSPARRKLLSVWTLSADRLGGLYTRRQVVAHAWPTLVRQGKMPGGWENSAWRREKVPERAPLGYLGLESERMRET
jgi:hypothetical protein